EIIRLWAAAEDYRDDIRLSPEIVARLSDSYRKLRNTLRYGLGNLYDFDPANDRVAPAALPRLDRYVRARLHRFVLRARAAYDAYELHQVYRGAVDFCSIELSALYFDVLKDRLYCSAKGDPSRRAAQTVLHEIVGTLCRLLAPILSFTCEEAYALLPGHAASVFVAGMPKADEGAFDPALEGSFASLLSLRTDVQQELEGLRREKTIGSSQEATVTLWPEADALRAALTEAPAELAELFIVSSVAVEGGPPPVGAKRGEETKAAIAVERSAAPRCPRCWNHRPTAPGSPLCARCQAVIASLPHPGMDGRA
ncbi:MAG: class I tRNA ligase family protein, partial [Deltaproteobacteria bacterium]